MTTATRKRRNLKIGYVRHVDSTGLKALLDCRNIFLQRSQRLATAGLSTMLLKTLNIVGLANSIPIFPSIDGRRRFSFP
jgi:anti-anti-sigma factor